MANDRSLQFDIEAIDRFTKAFESASIRLDKLSAKLDRLDRKRVNVDVDVNTKGAEAHLTGFSKVVARFGLSSGQGFSFSLSEAISDPHVIGVAVAAGFALAPAVAAAAATATVFAFGAGLSGLGAVITSKTAEGQRALEAFKSDATNILQATAKPFEGTFEDILNTAKDSLSGLSGTLREFYKQTGPAVSRFFGNLGDGVDELSPAIDELGVAFNAVLNTIGPELPGLFREISATAVRMETAVAENPQVFRDLGAAMATDVKGAADLITALTRLAGWFDQGPIDAAFFQALGGNIFTIISDITDLTSGQDKTGAAAKRAAVGMTTEAQSADQLYNALTQLANQFLGAEDANNSFLDSIHAANAGIKTNGKSLSEHTAKGRANREALSAAAHAALQLRDAVKDETHSNSAANQSLAESRARLVRLVEQFGLNKRAASAYVTQILGIPPVANTHAKFNHSSASKRLRAWIRELNNTPGKIFTTAQIVLQNQNALNKHAATGFAGGGPIRALAGGGFSGPVRGPGTSTSDSILIAGSDGEYMLSAFGVNRLERQGVDLDQLNQGKVPVAPVPTPSGPMMLEGELYLDTGQFLGMIRGVVRERDGESKSRVSAGTGAVR